MAVQNVKKKKSSIELFFYCGCQASGLLWAHELWATVAWVGEAVSVRSGLETNLTVSQAVASSVRTCLDCHFRGPNVKCHFLVIIRVAECEQLQLDGQLVFLMPQTAQFLSDWQLPSLHPALFQQCKNPPSPSRYLCSVHIPFCSTASDPLVKGKNK